MEKFAFKFSERFSHRFLVFCLFFCCCGIAFGISKSKIESIEIQPDTKEFFTAQENGYTVLFEGLDSYELQTKLPPLPLGVQFVSSQRSAYFTDEGERGTMIQFWFNFTDPGKIALPPLEVQIDKKTYFIPFAEVMVYENPNLISPVLEVSFDGNRKISEKNGKKYMTVKTGEKIRFKVSIKYCVQVLGYNWNLPKDSICNEIKRYDMANGTMKITEFTAEPVDIADFEWQPLLEGKYELPHVEIRGVAYNGAQRVMTLPEYEIEVAGKYDVEGKNVFSSMDELYEHAFDEVDDENSEKKISLEDCIKLAQLRSDEMNSFLWSGKAEERKEFENSLGIHNTDDEMNLPLIYLCFVGFAVAFAVTFLFFFKKSYYLAVTFFILTVTLFVISISGMVGMSRQYGVFCGDKIWTIPENSENTEKNASAGVRVTVVQEAGDWYYVDSANLAGWVQKSSVLLIGQE